MHENDDPKIKRVEADSVKGSNVKEGVRASLMMLAFGLGTLAFLVAIDRPDWFVLRPASGTAAAMSMAAAPPPGAETAATAPAASREIAARP